MKKLSSFFLAFLLLNFVILFHELGHLVASYLLNIPVKQLSLGFGSSLLSFQLANLECHIRLLPLGAFVEVDSVVFLKPSWEAVFISIMGPLFNFLLAFGTTYYLTFKLINKGSFLTDSQENLFYQFSSGALFLYNPDKRIFELANPQLGLRAISIKFNNFYALPFYPFISPLLKKEPINVLNLYFQHPAIKDYAEKNTRSFQGPIGIFKELAFFSSLGWEWSLVSAANISLSLGILNLLPLAFLDGGKLFTHLLSLLLNIQLPSASFLILILITLLLGFLFTFKVLNKKHED